MDALIQDLAGFVIVMCVVGVVLCVAIAILCMVVVVLGVPAHARVCVCAREPQQNPKRVTFVSSYMPKSYLCSQVE